MALGGKGVFDADGCLRVNVTVDDAFGLEFFETFREKAVAEAGDVGADSVEPRFAGEEGSDDEAHPALAKEGDGVLVPGAVFSEVV